MVTMMTTYVCTVRHGVTTYDRNDDRRVGTVLVDRTSYVLRRSVPLTVQVDTDDDDCTLSSYVRPLRQYDDVYRYVRRTVPSGVVPSVPSTVHGRHVRCTRTVRRRPYDRRTVRVRPYRTMLYDDDDRQYDRYVRQPYVGSVTSTVQAFHRFRRTSYIPMYDYRRYRRPYRTTAVPCRTSRPYDRMYRTTCTYVRTYMTVVRHVTVRTYDRTVPYGTYVRTYDYDAVRPYVRLKLTFVQVNRTRPR